MSELLPRSARPASLLSRLATGPEKRIARKLSFHCPRSGKQWMKSMFRNSIVFAIRFILASISRQIQSKILRALPRFARSCGLFWLQSSVKFRAKFREVCLASLGHVVYFGFNLPSNSEQKFKSSASLRSAMWFILASISRQIQSKNSRALPRFARPCGLFWSWRRSENAGSSGLKSWRVNGQGLTRGPPRKLVS